MQMYAYKVPRKGRVQQGTLVNPRGAGVVVVVVRPLGVQMYACGVVCGKVWMCAAS
jgi:hypothetical protein